MVEVITTKMTVGLMLGTVIEVNCRNRFAPSIAAASVQVARDGLHGREQDEGVVAGPAPVDHRGDGEVAGQPVGVPRDARQSDPAERLVDEAVAVSRTGCRR
jgi:hypothetical protein